MAAFKVTTEAPALQLNIGDHHEHVSACDSNAGQHGFEYQRADRHDLARLLAWSSNHGTEAHMKRVNSPNKILALYGAQAVFRRVPIRAYHHGSASWLEHWR